MDEFQIGDVFVGVGNGLIKRYDNTGNLLQTLNTTSGSIYERGICFDSSGNLYVMNQTTNTVSKFDNKGTLLTPAWGGPFTSGPLASVVNVSDNIYIGGGNDDKITKWDTEGTLLESYSPYLRFEGFLSMDFGADPDQCIMYYVLGGNVVKRFNVCTSEQETDFAPGFPVWRSGVRIRENGEVLVTSFREEIALFSAEGIIIRTYRIADAYIFTMDLDPDGEHFWTLEHTTGKIHKINIKTGEGTSAPVFTAEPEPGSSPVGLALFG